MSHRSAEGFAFPCLALALCAVWAGCGGGKSGGDTADNCGAVEPCGGNVVGTWKLSDACANSSALTDAVPSANCAAATTNVSGIAASGTITFDANGTYTITGATVYATLEVSLPALCVDGQTCVELSTQLDVAGYAFTCTGQSSCTCDALLPSYVGADEAPNETGNYVIAGSQLTLTAADGRITTENFCVAPEGSFLHFVSVDTSTSMGPMGQATITADVVATKQ